MTFFAQYASVHWCIATQFIIPRGNNFWNAFKAWERTKVIAVRVCGDRGRCHDITLNLKSCSFTNLGHQRRRSYIVASWSCLHSSCNTDQPYCAHRFIFNVTWTEPQQELIRSFSGTPRRRKLLKMFKQLSQHCRLPGFRYHYNNIETGGGWNWRFSLLWTFQDWPHL